MELFQKAAEAGNANAMNELGSVYVNGQGVERNIERGVGWYEKAAQSGSTAAMENLGSLYENGYGVEQDYEKAEEWYRKGAERYRKEAEAGTVAAMASLGKCYINGKGVTADSEEALRWFTKSLEAGYQWLDETYRNKAVQGTLNSLGYDCGTPDGESGPCSGHKGVLPFQHRCSQRDDRGFRKRFQHKGIQRRFQEAV